MAGGSFRRPSRPPQGGDASHAASNATSGNPSVFDTQAAGSTAGSASAKVAADNAAAAVTSGSTAAVAGGNMAPDRSADPAAGAGSASAETAAQLAAAQSELAALQDRFTRLQAEWDNYRKRTAQERNNERQTAAAQLLEKLLPVLDDLERAAEHTETTTVEALALGLQAIQSKLQNILQSEGLEAVDPLGQPFDIQNHQAVGRVEDPTLADETVTRVYQKGYSLRGRSLRPAMVEVSVGGPAQLPASAPSNALDGTASATPEME